MSESAQTAAANKTRRPLVLAILGISMFMAAIEGIFNTKKPIKC
ncbi:hypothetical protein SAMN05216243_1415 [Sediminibacillus albus]|uniref:Uncharacterized protein n=1 Tax=Sediminibacillus albus TaxID=407036 RepID=A0A1G8Y5J1_9BACI|nr:hypothetical protein SAMN05216243_1415 [Sediminibacillus albus]